MTVNIEAARIFIRTNARIVERRLAEFYLDRDETAAAAAINGLEAYRNGDGGFGHGLEPDVLAPDSQPLAADSAFDILGELASATSESPIRMRWSMPPASRCPIWTPFRALTAGCRSFFLR